MSINIKKVVVGPLMTNCYIVEKNETCLIIDPGDEKDKIIINPRLNKRFLIVLLL